MLAGIRDGKFEICAIRTIDIIAINDDDDDDVAMLGGAIMASITVRNLDDAVKHKLRIRAAEHGCSMEAEVREILTQAVNEVPRPRKGLATRIHERFKAIGGVELELPEREPMPEPPVFE